MHAASADPARADDLDLGGSQLVEPRRPRSRSRLTAGHGRLGQLARRSRRGAPRPRPARSQNLANCAILRRSAPPGARPPALEMAARLDERAAPASRPRAAPRVVKGCTRANRLGRVAGRGQRADGPRRARAAHAEHAIEVHELLARPASTSPTPTSAGGHSGYFEQVAHRRRAPPSSRSARDRRAACGRSASRPPAPTPPTTAAPARCSAARQLPRRRRAGSRRCLPARSRRAVLRRRPRGRDEILALAACAPSKMVFSISSTLMAWRRIAPSTSASTPTLSKWRTSSWNAAGERVARLTQLGTSPRSTKLRTMRTVSSAMAACAWLVDAPTWCVP